LDKPDESHELKTYENIFDFIDGFNDEDIKIYHEFQLAVEARNYTIVNKLLSSELKKYHETIDSELKAIKKLLTTTENSGLTNPGDGSVSYLSRVMGRWDLALLWSPCPFVVVSDPEATTILQDRIYDFKILEQESCQVINNMQIIPEKKGIEARFSGKTKKIQIGLDQDFPVSSIQGSWLDGVLPRDAIIALFSFENLSY
jgi:hypothetical protein